MRAGEDLVDQVVDEGERRVAIGALDVAGGPALDVASQVEQPGREGALAEVERDDVAGVVDELDKGRRLAAGRGRLAGIPGEALLFELRDELADAGASQAGEAGDGCARDRPEVVEGAEHQARVMGAGLRVGRLGWKLRAGHSCSDPCHSSSVSRSAGHSLRTLSSDLAKPVWRHPSEPSPLCPYPGQRIVTRGAAGGRGVLHPGSGQAGRSRRRRLRTRPTGAVAAARDAGSRHIESAATGRSGLPSQPRIRRPSVG